MHSGQFCAEAAAYLSGKIPLQGVAEDFLNINNKYILKRRKPNAYY
jgi:hypothetical protein